MYTRRDLLMTAGAATLAAGLPIPLPADDRSANVPRRFDRPAREMSAAVADGLTSAMTALVTSKAPDRPVVEVAAHAWHTARGHFGELGLTDEADRLRRDNDPMTAVDAARGLIPEIVARAERHGALIPMDALQRRMQLSPARVSAAAAFLEQNGTDGLFMQVEEFLSTRRAGVGRDFPAPGHLPLRSDTDGCQLFDMVIDALWLIAGLWTLGCAVTGGACVACCVAGAVIAVVAAALGLAYDYIC